MDVQRIKKLLEAQGQAHVLRWWDELDEGGQKKLSDQIGHIDWNLLPLATQHKQAARGKIEPIDGLDLEEIEKDRSRYLAVGKEAVRSGKVAAVLLAGGQGTRLGNDAPKGTFGSSEN